MSLPTTASETGWDCIELLGDFPVDWFLFHRGSNYVQERTLGKPAHQARVQLENIIHHQPMSAILDFWAAAARLGIGRNITAFLTPQK